MRSQGKTIVAAVAICALFACAFSAPSASALELTAVKCVSRGAGFGNYSAECPTPKSPGGGFETEALTPGAPATEVEGQATTAEHKAGETSKPVAVFKATVGGIAVEVTCGKATSTGKLENIAGPPMQAKGTEGVLTYTECHASKQTDTTTICTVQQGAGPVGTIVTNPLTATTVGTEHTVEVKSEVSETFVEFTILKGAAPCFTPAVNLPVKVTGKLNTIANTATHSHLTATPATNGTAFKTNGATATYESTQQAWMKGAPGELVGVETL